jgi:hypothetical protein
LFEAVPRQVHTLLTARGCRFAGQPCNRNRIRSWPMRFDGICAACGIGHRLTKRDHLWTKDSGRANEPDDQ